MRYVDRLPGGRGSAMKVSPKIKVAIVVSCNQSKIKGRNKDEPPYFWPLDKETTFDFSVTPLKRPKGWKSDSASFRIVVPKKIPTTKSSKENNTAEGVAAFLARALNAKLKDTGVKVSSGAGGKVADGQNLAGSRIGLLIFEWIKGLDTAWDYSKVSGWVWGEPGKPGPGEPEPPDPKPSFPKPGEWPGWGPGGKPKTPKNPRKPGGMPGSEGPESGKPETTGFHGFGPHKSLIVGIYLAGSRDSGFAESPGGWHFHTLRFPVEWTQEQVASVVMRCAGDLDRLKPSYPTDAEVTGIMWGVSASEGSPTGVLHYMLRLDPMEIRPVLPTVADTREHIVCGSLLPSPGREEPSLGPS